MVVTAFIRPMAAMHKKMNDYAKAEQRYKHGVSGEQMHTMLVRKQKANDSKKADQNNA
tara:strand:- start:871 stop:1044 length:174 start_codon:yes stop_codon:yes gene_type:complete